MSTSQPPVLSFVMPVLDEVSNVEPLAARLVHAGQATGVSFELIWVDDGSVDGSDRVLDELAVADPRHRIYHFSRNFGHMAALTAGLELARGSGAVICLDADGQHPPELIPQLVDAWRAGADIVQATRRHTQRAGPFKRGASHAFYRIFNLLADLDLPPGASDFRLMDRQVVDALNDLPERVRFVRGLVYWAGYRRQELPYDAPSRMSGRTKYSPLRMLGFALSGITSFSHRPLRLAFLAGVLVTLAAAAYGGWVLWCAATGVTLVKGWTSTLLVVLGLSGVQLLTLGIASEYLARLYFEQKQRPVYLLRKPRPQLPATPPQTEHDGRG
jgi:dolichol-phosphate mannosyltransferase